MGLTDLVKNLFSKEQLVESSQLSYQVQDQGLTLQFPEQDWEQAKRGAGTDLVLHQFLRMQMLLEEGIAQDLPCGIFLAPADAAALDADSRYIFNLPAPWPGAMQLQISGRSTEDSFALQLNLRSQDDELIRYYQFDSPLLQLSESEIYLPDALQWDALNTIAEHQHSPHQEYDNLAAVNRLISASKAGLDLDCAAFNDFQVCAPDKVGLAVEVQADGSLELMPSFGEGLDQTLVAKRLGQLHPDGKAQSLRVGKQLILLDEPRLKAAHEIIQKRYIPLSQRSKFFAAPGSFLDADLIHLDNGFSLRVKGAGPFQQAYFGETGGNEIQWFQAGAAAGTEMDALIENWEDSPALVAPEALSEVISDLPTLADFRQSLADAQQTNASCVHVEGRQVDISDPVTVLKAVEELEVELQNAAEEQTEDTGPIAIDIHLNDMESDFGEELQPPPKGIRSSTEIDFAEYSRTPFPHQVEGIRWMLALAQNQGQPLGPKQKVEGALLADDMGLGKTYMTIVGIREILLHTQSEKPVLVVAPLSLLENWKREVEDTYKTPLFERIITLQSDGDLPQYRIEGMGVETKAPLQEETATPIAEPDTDIPPWEDLPEILQENTSTAVENEPQETATTTETETETEAEAEQDFYPPCSLKVGLIWEEQRLDLPRTLVLTTFQTLRDYQFSLASVNWSIAAFDEAQNIKSPNTLQTRAAKALNADFKLLMTGTPVENHLGEFWCLFDTLQPGFLGSYQEFRQNYIKPILKAPKETAQEVREEIGQALRDTVGGFMLRRIKEDHLKNLPKKHIILGDYNADGDFIFDERISCEMAGEQRLRYEEVVDVTIDKMEAQQGVGTALLGLQQLRDASLHPTLLQGVPELPQTPETMRVFLNQSEKMRLLLDILDGVREREEKALVFAVNKRLQEMVALGVSRIYGLSVPIINGETKAVSKNPNNPTRQGLIDHFQEQPGFGVMLISPVAAGVGLTITAANNVIHLERHWNPAKEAQATDRAYRIGQKKDVNVYIPILTHPDFDSFDVNLNRLLSGKTSLKDAIIVQEEIKTEELAGSGVFQKRESA
ncbi:DEAD/DEAH box helicase [Candidatus Venteria ishoeyi]|uniref:ATP-dependent helicase HepA n=1 Tax=Candidatus Venteria ishoeyi TaxID=1899563 RepID=A0A1H6FB76_9GAMM|nr:DEAD/DEAH box helicase [Candidatus Venteria ishoeyi]SEH07342.1 Uncharacterised protein [Candidatus Venteria ishoeyi]